VAPGTASSATTMVAAASSKDMLAPAKVSVIAPL
jgi:hypothetical protein